MQRSKKFVRFVVLLFVMAFTLVSVFAFAACVGDGESVDDTSQNTSGESGNDDAEGKNQEDTYTDTADSEDEKEDEFSDGEDTSEESEKHGAEASSDEDFFFNMFKILFSGRYSVTSEGLEFGVKDDDGYECNFEVDGGEAYAVYDEDSGLRIYSSNMHMSYHEDRSYGTQYFYDYNVDGYGDGEYFYLTFEEDQNRTESNGTTYEYEPDIEYTRYSYDYFIKDFELDEVVDYIEAMEKTTVSDTFDALDSFLAEYLSSSFLGAMAKSKTSYGYAMTLNLEKVSELNKSLYEDTLSEIFNKVFGDGEYEKMIENVEKLLNGKVEDEVDNLLKYGEDYGVTKNMVSELINIFTDYGDLDEFMEEYDGQNEIVAEAFGWDTEEIIEEIEEYKDKKLYAELFGSSDAEDVYEMVQKWIDALIESDVEVTFDTYTDGTLIDIGLGFESGASITWGEDETYYARGKITIGFDAVMPDDANDSVKTVVEAKLSKLDAYMRGKIETDANGEYVFYSYTYEKMWATLENNEVIIHYTRDGINEVMRLSGIGYFWFEPESDYVWFEIGFCGAETGRICSGGFSIYFDSSE